MNFLKTAANSIRKFRGEAEFDAMDFVKFVREVTKKLNITDDMLKRSVNSGFSGGEKKEMKYFKWQCLSQPYVFWMRLTVD